MEVHRLQSIRFDIPINMKFSIATDKGDLSVYNGQLCLCLYNDDSDDGFVFKEPIREDWLFVLRGDNLAIKGLALFEIDVTSWREHISMEQIVYTLNSVLKIEAKKNADEQKVKFSLSGIEESYSDGELMTKLQFTKNSKVHGLSTMWLTFDKKKPMPSLGNTVLSEFYCSCTVENDEWSFKANGTVYHIDIPHDKEFLNSVNVILSKINTLGRQQ